MRLSIIIPIYNAKNTLEVCLESIRYQSFKDYEVIMVNDGSKDSSEDIAQRFADLDTRFNYIYQDNAGPGAARNKGIELAKGEFIIFVDADDWLEEDCLSNIMSDANDIYDAVIWGFTEEWNDRKQVVIPKAFNSNDTKEILQKVCELKKNVQYGMSWNCRFRNTILKKNDIRMSLDVKLHEDCIFTNWYFQHVRSMMVLPYSGYHYVHPVGESLCSRKHFPSDETFSMALQMHESVATWLKVPQLGRYEIYNYISKLSLSVLDMYKKADLPRKSYSKRLQRIRFVKAETCRYYSELSGNRKKTHYIFRFLPVCMIDLVYRIMIK